MIVDVKDLHGKTPLHYAVMNNALACLSVLLASGADPNMPYRPGGVKSGETPLHIAVRKGHIATARTLVTYGADVNAHGTHNSTPLHLAMGCGHQLIADFLISKGQWLMLRVRVNDCVASALLIDHAGADMKKEDNLGHFPLQTAIAHSREIDVDRFVEANAFAVNYANSRGETCLHTAASYERTSIAEKLVRLGCDINVKDCCDRTPLHWAVRESRVAFVELLGRQVGLSLEDKDTFGDSPLQYGNHFFELLPFPTLLRLAIQRSK